MQVKTLKFNEGERIVYHCAICESLNETPTHDGPGTVNVQLDEYNVNVTLDRDPKHPRVVGANELERLA